MMLNCFSTLCNFTFRNYKSLSQIHVFFFADLAYEPPWANVPEQSPTINETPSSPTLPEIPAPIPSPRSEITPPKPAPRSLKLPPSGRKFKYEDFQLLKVLGKGSFGKVSALVLLFIIWYVLYRPTRVSFLCLLLKKTWKLNMDMLHVR